MSKSKQLTKLKLVQQHRENQYGYTLDKLIEGRVKPADVTLRYQKLKAVRRG